MPALLDSQSDWHAAGKNPDLQRCAEGLALWEQYNQAGEPPHFLWLRRERKRA